MRDESLSPMRDRVWLLLRLSQPALAHRIGQRLQQLLALVPSDTAVRNTLAVDERLAWKQILRSCLEMAFGHHSRDAPVPRRDLLRDVHPGVDLLFELF